jgi:hypothetical protein
MGIEGVLPSGTLRNSRIFAGIDLRTMLFHAVFKGSTCLADVKRFDFLVFAIFANSFINNSGGIGDGGRVQDIA